MLSTLATVVLVFLGIVVFLNIIRGSFGSWFRAKFLNQVAA